MSVRFLAAALMLVLASALSANEAVKVTQTYAFRVSVDEQGKVTGAEPLNAIPAPVLATATGMAHDADFEPARVAGRPVPSRTVVNVHMDYEGDQRHLRVVSTRVTSGARLDATPPRYPRDAMRREIGALAATTLTFRTDGSLDTEASRIDSIELIGSTRTSRVDPIRKSLEDAVWATIASWTIMADEVDGQLIAMTTQVPISFCANAATSGKCENQRIRKAQPSRDPAEPGDESAGLLAVDAGIQLARLKPTVPGTQVAEQP